MADKGNSKGLGMDDGLKRNLIILAVFGVVGCFAAFMWLGRSSKAEAKPQQQEPAAVTPVIVTVAPLPSPMPVEANPPQPAKQSPPEPIQLTATAQFRAAINRPAGNPQSSPFFVGVITYESGCTVSNIGFTTSGLNGNPYYLYFSQPLDRDPLMQMVNLTGYVQKFTDCAYPVIMVSQIYWLNDQATPAPLAIGGPYTETITGTIAGQWGQGIEATNTPTRTITHPEAFLQEQMGTPTPYPTYTPYPTTAPWVPPATLVPTATPNPTKTPKPTSTPTPTATPVQANLNGAVITIAGCSQTNMGIKTASGVIPMMLFGAALPTSGQPTDYWATASGKLGVICDQTGLWATSVNWYTPPTATPTSTPTSTPTATPTSTSTSTATPTATNTATPEPTATATATAQPAAGDENAAE